MTLIFIRFKDKVLGIGRAATCTISNQKGSICDIAHHMGKETCCGGFAVGTCHTKTSELAHKVSQKFVVTFIVQA